MGEWSANNRADLGKAVWDRLLGFFGDALLRKWGPEPPPEWESALCTLQQREVERGFKRLLYGWKGGPPNLPDFMRLCRSVGDEIDDGPRPIALPRPDEGKFDGWDITGNNRFMNYVKKRLAGQPRAWGAPGSTHHANATRIAVAYKNAWAQDMREGGTLDPVTGEFAQPSRPEQDRNWSSCMERAEADIAALMARKAA
jgi:hypothetical protein